MEIANHTVIDLIFFVLAIYTGYYMIRRVTLALQRPMMVPNAILAFALTLCTAASMGAPGRAEYVEHQAAGLQGIRLPEVRNRLQKLIDANATYIREEGGTIAPLLKRLGLDALDAEEYMRRSPVARDIFDLRSGRRVQAQVDQSNQPVSLQADLGGDVSASHELTIEQAGDFEERIDGRRVMRAFLRSPVEFSRVSSAFGGRYHPLHRHWTQHNGVDLAAPAGTQVFATEDGIVEFIGRRGGYGNLILLKHQNGFSTSYAHLSRFAVIHRGELVRRGQLIGYVGKTGCATGPHLHYEVRFNDIPQNPLSITLIGTTGASARSSSRTPVLCSVTSTRCAPMI
ncbi:hypothetical protein CS8_003230 [Cupriavidus sp. 8B]